MKFLTYLLLISQISLSSQYDDFSEIPLKEMPGNKNQTSEEKSITLPLFRTKSVKDHIKDKLFHKHAGLSSDHPVAQAAKDFKVDTDKSLSYFTKLYVGSL